MECFLAMNESFGFFAVDARPSDSAPVSLGREVGNSGAGKGPSINLKNAIRGQTGLTPVNFQIQIPPIENTLI
ncbi:hypothetical protein CGGC5_v012119 [Colletotrichum fructicola Nara gc5]|uniref:Uncharacterized protein n=1 Tax=Colletotrichum fructicola (strain Nara gc5) TaxID=1213859 RepID=A0A7J6ITJ9_COLFN|nr:hypothetical protein CGGC5_v012119 [Colletotrichum fructicola Nara gc5]